MDFSNLLIPICALSCVCVGLIGVIVFLVFTFTGRSIMPAITDFLGGSDEDAGIENRPRPRRKRSAGSGSSLRNRERSLDFDSAVQRHQRGGQAKGKVDRDRPKPRRLGSAGRFEDSGDSGRGGRRSRGSGDGDFEIYEEDDGFDFDL